MPFLQTLDGGLFELCRSLTIPLYEQIRQWNPELFHPMFQRIVRIDFPHTSTPEPYIVAPLWMNDDEWPFESNERLLLVMSTEVQVNVRIHSVDGGPWLMDVVFSPTPPPGHEEMMQRHLSFWYEPQYSLAWTCDEYGMYETLRELLDDHLPRLCDFPSIQRSIVKEEIVRQVQDGICSRT